MDELENNDKKMGKWLLVTAIFFTLYFAGRLIYYIVVNGRRQLWVGLAVLMLISAIEAIRLYLAIKRESKKKDD